MANEGTDTVRCESCGLRAEQTDGTTPGGDTWFEVWMPWDLSERIGVEHGYCCSLNCVERFVRRIRGPYEEIEADLVNDPRHRSGGRALHG